MSSFLSLDTQTTNTAPALHTQHCCTPIFFVWLPISGNSASRTDGFLEVQCKMYAGYCIQGPRTRSHEAGSMPSQLLHSQPGPSQIQAPQLSRSHELGLALET